MGPQDRPQNVPRRRLDDLDSRQALHGRTSTFRKLRSSLGSYVLVWDLGFGRPCVAKVLQTETSKSSTLGPR